MSSNSHNSSWLQLVAKRILEAERKGADVGVFLLSNEEMEKIRERLGHMPHFVGKEAEKIATEEVVEVLSLPSDAREGSWPVAEEAKKERHTLGEIYINKTYASTKEERLRLLIHGVLHLLGFSHSGKHDKMKMERKEQEIFTTLLEQWPESLQD